MGVILKYLVFSKKMVYFRSSLNWRYTTYNTVIYNIFIESDEALTMRLLENNVEYFKKAYACKMKLIRKDA